jgi:hypothetical protein
MDSLTNAYYRTKWSMQDRFKGKNPFRPKAQREYARKEMLKAKTRAAAVQNVKELQAKVQPKVQPKAQPKVSGKTPAKWAPVQTGGKAAGVGVSKSGYAGSKPFSYNKPATVDGGVFKKGIAKSKIGGLPKIGGLAKMGLGMAGGLVGDLIKEEIAKGRKDPTDPYWGIADTLNNVISFGAGALLGPLAPLLLKPLLEVGAQGAKKGAVPGSMGPDKDTADFWEYITKNNISLPPSFEEQDRMFKEWLAWRDKQNEPKEEENYGSCEPIYAEGIDDTGKRPTSKGPVKLGMTPEEFCKLSGGQGAQCQGT